MALLKSCSSVRAFTTARPSIRQSQLCTPSTVCKAKNSGSYMVEVQVGEEEPEDSAVRRFMKQVMDSRVIEQLRARKTVETKIVKYKRELRERIELNKAGWVEPTWEQMYGLDPDPKPFDDFFDRDDEEENTLLRRSRDDAIFDVSYPDLSGMANGGQQWGGYMDANRTTASQGGYIANQAGGYIDGYQQSGTAQQGGYINNL